MPRIEKMYVPFLVPRRGADSLCSPRKWFLFFSPKFFILLENIFILLTDSFYALADSADFAEAAHQVHSRTVPSREPSAPRTSVNFAESARERKGDEAGLSLHGNRVYGVYGERINSAA